MNLRIDGLAVATPTGQIAQADAAKLAQQLSPVSSGRGLDALYRLTGVKNRHSVLLHEPPRTPHSSDDGDDSIPKVTQSFYEPALADADFGPTTATRMQCYEAEASRLAVAAARSALNDAACPAGAVTHLVTVSCSGFAAPGFDLALLRELELPAQTQRTHVGYMGCHGAINGLRVAQAFAASQLDAVVLLCAVELCSLHHQYHAAADQLVANALFADGAGAVVLRNRPSENGAAGSDDRQNMSHGTDRAGWTLLNTDSTVIPGTEDLMSWRIRDHGFQMTLSPRVPEIIERDLRPWLTRWLSQSGLSLEDIRSWAIHPGGPRVVQACGHALNLTAEQIAPSLSVLADFGNMSSPTVLFILDRLRHQHATGPCVTLAFGPGLTIEAALLQR